MVAERQSKFTLTVGAGVHARSVHVALDDLSLLRRNVLRWHLAVILVLLEQRIDVIKQLLSLDVAHRYLSVVRVAVVV